MTIKMLSGGIRINGSVASPGSYWTLADGDEAVLVGRGVAEYAEDWAASLLPPIGTNTAFGVIESINGGSEYVAGAGVTTATAIILGNVGDINDVLEAVYLSNGSGSAFTDFTIQDGGTTLDWLDVGALKTLANGAKGSLVIPGGPLKSRNGAWKITITCAGTMASIKYGAKGLFS